MNIIGFVLSFGLFVLGLFLMGAAFETPGMQLFLFPAGIVSSSLGLFIPVHILKRINS